MQPRAHEFTIEGHRLTALELNPGAVGEPIVLLHGINLSPRFWLTDAVFVQHGPCYALSLPGHAPARFPPGFGPADLTPELIARLLEAVIRRLVGGRPVTLAGISTGGFATLAVAACAPDLVRRAICISGFAQGRWSGLLRLYQWLARMGGLGRWYFAALFAISQRSRQSYRDNVWPWFVADRAALRAYPRFEALIDNTFDDWRAQDMAAMIAYYRQMPDIDISSWLPRIAAPTLVLTGDHDPIVPSAQSQLIAARVPNAKLVVVPGAGHLLFAERPQVYYDIIGDWLRQTHA